MYVTKRRHRVGRSIKINKYQMSLAYFSLRAYCTLINREAIWINREKAGRGRVIRIRRREGEKPLGPRSQMTTRIWVPDLGFWDLGVRSWKVLSITHDLSDCSMYHHIFSYKCPVCRSTLFLFMSALSTVFSSTSASPTTRRSWLLFSGQGRFLRRVG